jgi:hypothetical protein
LLLQVGLRQQEDEIVVGLDSYSRYLFGDVRAHWPAVNNEYFLHFYEQSVVDLFLQSAIAFARAKQFM